MHATDKLIDTGEVDARQAALQRWDEETTAALEGSGPPEKPVLLALWDMARRHPHMAARVRAFLDGAAVEASWTGFDSEADFQAYVDSYSLPALMLTASLLAPDPDAGADEPFVRGCRALIEGWQRCDFLADLSEDADQGRIGIPQEELDRYGLKFEDVRSKSEACVPALEQLVVAQAGRAEEALAECRAFPSLVTAECRPFLDALIGVQELRLLAVKQAGGSLLLREAGPGMPAALRVLARQYRHARTQQRRAQ
jgi:phytoene synthase